MAGPNFLLVSVPLRTASMGIGVVLPVLAQQQLGDLALGGFLTGIALAPALLVAPLAGAVLDRLRAPRRLVVATGAAAAIAYAGAALLGVAPTWLVALGLLLSGAAGTVSAGGLSSFVTDGFDRPDRAYAVDSLSYLLAGIAGPAIAGLVIAIADARAAMLVFAASSAVGAVAAMGLRMLPHGAVESPGAAIRAGARHLLRHRPIAVVTASGTVAAFAHGGAALVAAAIGIERFGLVEAGPWMITAYAVGGLACGTAVAARRWTRLPPAFVMGLGFAGTGAALAAAALAPTLPLVLLAFAAAGAAGAPANAAMLLLRDLESPASVRSQVFTVSAALRTASGAAAAVVVALLLELPASLLLVAVGAIWVLSAAMLLALPRRDAQGLAGAPA